MSLYSPPQWIARLSAECDEVHGRIVNLRAFIMGGNFERADAVQRMLMAIQLSSMMTYHGVLVCRLGLLGITKEIVK